MAAYIIADKRRVEALQGGWQQARGGARASRGKIVLVEGL